MALESTFTGDMQVWGLGYRLHARNRKVDRVEQRFG